MSESTPVTARSVDINASGAPLEGNLAIPEEPLGLVLFAHGSGSSRFSPRNRFVAEQLQRAGLATLLFDLLTAEENEVDQQTREYRFDIDRLATRLTATVDWAADNKELADYRIGLFGASTGAAAALMTAADRPDQVGAVVSRGGRPDMAGDALAKVRCPTLLIVGGNDPEVLHLNRQAGQAMRCDFDLQVVPGASHLFEEPGKLEAVAELACDWFVEKFAAATVADRNPRR